MHWPYKVLGSYKKRVYKIRNKELLFFSPKTVPLWAVFSIAAQTILNELA